MEKDDAATYRQIVDALIREFTDKGKLVELGWLAMRKHKVPHTATPAQIREMRLCYMAGAQHIFASMMQMMDEDREPTANDMARMGSIHMELEQIAKELKGWGAH